MARDPVKISRNLDDNALSNELYVGISDGTEQLLVNADGSINTTINNASIVVTATDLDIRDLSASQDNVAISDGTDSLDVNADGSINSTINNGAGASAVNIQDGGNSITVDGTVAISGSVTVTATDLDIRDLSAAQDNVAISDGTDTLAIAADGSIAVTDNGGSLTVDGTVAATQSGTWDIGTVTTLTGITNDVNIADGGNSITVDDGGGTLTVDGSVTVSATDLDIRDLSASQDNVALSDGTDTLAINTDGSINVVVGGTSGTAIADYDLSSLGSSASDNHDYTASGGAFVPTSVSVSSESIATFEILANAVAIATLRTSVENPNAVYEFPANFSIADTQVLRVTRTNDSNKTKNVNSTINGTQQ